MPKSFHKLLSSQYEPTTTQLPQKRPKIHTTTLPSQSRRPNLKQKSQTLPNTTSLSPNKTPQHVPTNQIQCPTSRQSNKFSTTSRPQLPTTTTHTKPHTQLHKTTKHQPRRNHNSRHSKQKILTFPSQNTNKHKTNIQQQLQITITLAIKPKHKSRQRPNHTDITTNP